MQAGRPEKLKFKLVNYSVTSYLYFPITDKIQAPWFLFPHLSQSTQILCAGQRSSLFHFPKIRAGKSVKQVNKFEMPKCGIT